MEKPPGRPFYLSTTFFQTHSLQRVLLSAIPPCLPPPLFLGRTMPQIGWSPDGDSTFVGSTTKLPNRDKQHPHISALTHFAIDFATNIAAAVAMAKVDVSDEALVASFTSKMKSSLSAKAFLSVFGKTSRFGGVARLLALSPTNAMFFRRPNLPTSQATPMCCIPR